MRHQSKKHTLGKAQDQRKALLRSLATELILHGEIKTTMARAKALKPYAEHIITLAKQGTLHSRRLAAKFIFDKETGKFYIGQKKIIKVEKRPPLKGKVRKRKIVKQSDWKTYCGSSNDLKNDIKTLGEDKFRFTIIRFCDCKWKCSYWELYYQMQNHVFNLLNFVGLNSVHHSSKLHYFGIPFQSTKIFTSLSSFVSYPDLLSGLLLMQVFNKVTDHGDFLGDPVVKNPLRRT